ncbi:MAG TPA: hypothetical protein VF588_02150 [Pyrinomonadaceae bacterium]|jgi:hypothetical protein
MFARRKAPAPARAALLALAALAALATVAPASAQTEPPRKPQGPAVGPAIKLPRGAGAGDERTQPAGARQDGQEAERAGWAPQKWEYCFIRGIKYNQKGLSLSSSSRTPAAVVRYFPNGSEEFEGATEEDALANAFAKLGEDGWELTAVRTDFSLSDGNGHTFAAYFFKRPKRQE